MFAGCRGTGGTGDKELTWIVVGTEAADNPEVFKLFNERLKEETGLTVKFEYIATEQYDLKFAAGDAFDIVYCPVANDKVYAAFALYEGGIIDKQNLISELKAYKLVDQYLFHTDKAVKTLKFIEAKEVTL